jgi:hypothetical protein
MNRTYTPRPKLRDREPGTITPLQGVVYARIGGDVATVQKGKVVRHEGYRRLVAALPCKHCGIAGISQAAHPNTGKGAGIKTGDLECFPLCCDTPGRPGCHPKFDQGALFTKAVRREIEKAWSADTRRAIEAAGEWPEKLERLA